VCISREVVLGDEFLWDNRELDFDVFWSVKGCPKVKVRYVEAGEPTVWFG
jgi:hypothetical protein